MRRIETWLLDKLLQNCGNPRYATVSEYQSGDVIFSVGDTGDYLALVLNGQVEIKRHGKTVSIIESGSIFGEMGLIDRVPRSADALARSHCRVAKLREGQFTSMLETTPHFALSMMRILTDRLRSSTAT